ncbi:MAG: hypothetical protein LBD38_00910 [Streptococcaceae bacterium]|nr:hypothetical protein [Streptococcaceae bacterium]
MKKRTNSNKKIAKKCSLVAGMLVLCLLMGAKASALSDLTGHETIPETPEIPVTSETPDITEILVTPEIPEMPEMPVAPEIQDPHFEEEIEIPSSSLYCAFTSLMVDGHAVNLNTRELTDDVHTISGTIQLSNGVGQEYYYKDNEGNKNAFSSLCFKKTGAFKYAVFTDVSIDKTDPSKLNFTASNIDGSQSGSFTISSENNVFEVNQTFVFQFSSLTASLENKQILDTQETSTPSYTAHVLLKNCMIGKKLQPSDFSLEGAFSDATITSIQEDENDRGVVVHFTKPNFHPITGHEVTGSLVLRNGVNTLENNAYRNPISVEIEDTYAPAITYDFANSNAPSVNAISTTTKVTNTVLKVFGDVMEKTRSVAAYKACPLIGLGVDLMLTFLQGGQNDLVMQKLEVMDQKLDLLQSQISQVSNSVWDAASRTTALQQLARYDDDISFLMHDDSEKMAIENANKAITILNDASSTRSDQQQAATFLQSLFSSTNDNTKHLQAFKKLGKDLSGSSDLSVLNGQTAISVLNNYLRVENDWNTTGIEDRKAFLGQMSLAYSYLYATFLTAIEYDYEVNVNTKEALESQKEALVAVDPAKLTPEQKADVKDEIDDLTTRLRSLEAPIKIDQNLLDKNGSPLDSLQAANEAIQTSFKEENDAITREVDDYNNGIIKSNRLNKNFKRTMIRTRTLSLYIHFKGNPEQEGDFKKLNNYNVEKNNTQDLKDYSKLCSEGDFNALEASASQRGLNLAAEMKTAGFNTGNYGEDVWALFTGKVTKDYDSWGSLWNPGHYYGGVEFYNDTQYGATNKTGRSNSNALSETMSNWGKKEFSYLSRDIFTLNYI